MAILSPAGPPISVDRGVFQDQLPRMRGVHSAAQLDSCRFKATWWHPVISSRAPHGCSSPLIVSQRLACNAAPNTLPHVVLGRIGGPWFEHKRHPAPVVSRVGVRWWIHPATVAAAAPVPPHVMMDRDYGVCGTLQKSIVTLHAHAWHGARTIQHTLVQAGSPGVRHRDKHMRSVPCSHVSLRRFSNRSMASRTSSARLVCSASAKRSSAAS